MLVAARLTEGATYLKGFAGLRDSVTLLTRLLADCWDRVHPFPEDGERLDDVRGGPLLWLNDSSRGARFPYSITSVPIVDLRGDRFGHTDLRGARRAEFDTFFQNLKPQAADTVRKQITDANDDLAAIRAELQKPATVVDERMPELGINLLSGSGTIGGVLFDVAETVTDLMHASDSRPAGESGEGASGSEEAASGAGRRHPSQSGRRGPSVPADIIADALQRLEPHSPIPFLIKRSVKLGACVPATCAHDQEACSGSRSVAGDRKASRVAQCHDFSGSRPQAAAIGLRGAVLALRGVRSGPPARTAPANRHDGVGIRPRR